MAEYMTTEAEVRECFQASAEGLDFKREYYERGETFDRFMAEVRREAAEKAWDEWHSCEYPREEDHARFCLNPYTKKEGTP